MHTVVVGALVREGRVLLVHRRPDKHAYPDLWDLPGGLMEPGESELDALGRELHEELGVRVATQSATHLTRLSVGADDQPAVLSAWLVREWDGTPTNVATEEHDDLAWCDLDQLPPAPHVLARTALATVPVVEEVRELVVQHRPGSPLGLYLTGSSCEGGLRPDSDLDLLLVTSRSLDAAERRLLVDHLLTCSGRRATRRPGRPVELTCLVVDDIRPWRYPATCDFLYGEWLRADYEAGRLPGREVDPNLPVLLTSARRHSSPLLGPPLDELTDPVPPDDLRRSLFDALPDLLGDFESDERNVLLTLARIVHTLRTGTIAPKDNAAAAVAGTLAPQHARVLDLAARAYRGEVADDWSQLPGDASATLAALAEVIDALR
ncbi:MAG: aminoglycoside adenylyltransferase family protein [Angustibacter sp.]